MDNYIKENHKDDVRSILEAQSLDEVPFVALPINLSTLNEKCSELFKKITFRLNVWEERAKWVKALNDIQIQMLEPQHFDCSVKLDFPVTFFNLPNFTNEHFTFANSVGEFVQVEGRIIRVSDDDSLKEVYRRYRCRKCKQDAIIKSERQHNFYFDEPGKCIATKDCTGSMDNTEDPAKDKFEVKKDFYIKYQEISILLNDRPGLMALNVELEAELVGKCDIGEMVKVCGTYETRKEKHMIQVCELVIRAVDIQPSKQRLKLTNKPFEMEFLTLDDWNNELQKHDHNELALRDEIVSSVAPELTGLALVKLGILLTLCSGGSTSHTDDKDSSQTRDICHLLLAGDPGMGKSQLLKAAAKISDNSVSTVGYSTTTAGLTAHFYRENGRYFIEGGALIRANNGICCIDEINLMSKEHRGSIHEVMETQNISFNKAKILINLPTKCSIIAGMNAKNPLLPLEGENFALEASLLSRFDLIFAFENTHDAEFENAAIDHILLGGNSDLVSNPLWSTERLKQHVVFAKEIQPEMTASAHQILKKYFMFCRYQEGIDISRHTMRLWHSLERLTICHAKLMLRSKVEIIDALTVVMLMEFSWTFGCLLKPHPVAMSTTPLGPSKEKIITILERLELEHLIDQTISQPKLKSSQPSQSILFENLETLFDEMPEAKCKTESKQENPLIEKMEHQTDSDELMSSFFEELKSTSTQKVTKMETNDSGINTLKHSLMQLTKSLTSSASLSKPKTIEQSGTSGNTSKKPLDSLPSTKSVSASTGGLDKLKNYQYFSQEKADQNSEVTVTQSTNENLPSNSEVVDPMEKHKEFLKIAENFKCFDDLDF